MRNVLIKNSNDILGSFVFFIRELHLIMKKVDEGWFIGTVVSDLRLNYFQKSKKNFLLKFLRFFFVNFWIFFSKFSTQNSFENSMKRKKFFIEILALT